MRDRRHRMRRDLDAARTPRPVGPERLRRAAWGLLSGEMGTLVSGGQGDAPQVGLQHRNGLMWAKRRGKGRPVATGCREVESSRNRIFEVIFGKDADRDSAANLSLIKAPVQRPHAREATLAPCSTDFLEYVVEPLLAVSLPMIGAAESVIATPG